MPIVVGVSEIDLKNSEACTVCILGWSLKKASAAPLQGTNVLARTPFNSSYKSFCDPRAHPPRCGRLQARRRTDLLTPFAKLPSTCAPLSPRAHDALSR